MGPVRGTRVGDRVITPFILVPVDIVGTHSQAVEGDLAVLPALRYA